MFELILHAMLKRWFTPPGSILTGLFTPSIDVKHFTHLLVNALKHQTVQQVSAQLPNQYELNVPFLAI